MKENIKYFLVTFKNEIFLSILILIGFLFYKYEIKKSNDNIIEAIEKQKDLQNQINIDSIISLNNRILLDSIKSQTEYLNKKIEYVKQQNNAINEINKNFYSNYNNININRPKL